MRREKKLLLEALWMYRSNILSDEGTDGTEMIFFFFQTKKSIIAVSAERFGQEIYEVVAFPINISPTDNTLLYWIPFHPLVTH
jgi:hypothetical protein